MSARLRQATARRVTPGSTHAASLINRARIESSAHPQRQEALDALADREGTHPPNTIGQDARDDHVPHHRACLHDGRPALELAVKKAKGSGV